MTFYMAPVLCVTCSFSRTDSSLCFYAGFFM